MALPRDIVRVLVAVAGELDTAVQPVARAARHPASLQRLLHQVGWDIDGLLTADQQAVLDGIESMQDAVANVMAGPVAVEEVSHLAEAVAGATISLAAAAAEVEPIIETALTADGVAVSAGVVDDLSARLIADVGDLLLLRWLQHASPTMLAILRMVGVVTTVRRPALYLHDPPALPPSEPATTPVRWAMQRQGLNTDGLANPLVLGLVSLLEDLPRDAYRSPATFLAAVQAVVTERLDQLLAELTAHPIGEVAVTISGDGVAITAANWLPTTLVDWDTPIEFPIEGPSGPLPLPLTARIERETWSLLWDPAGTRDLFEVVADVLFLVDRFDATPDPARSISMPGLTLTVDATDPAAITAAFAMTLGFELRIAPGAEPAELAITAGATLGADGVEVSVGAAVLDTLEIPLLVPGLTGLAIGFVGPSLQLIANVDEDPRLDVHVTLSSFTLHLPTEIFRKAEADGDGWMIVEGEAPVVTMTLPANEPLLSLGVATVAGRPVVDRFEFLPVISDAAASWQLGFSADAIYVGAGDIATGLIVEIDATTYTAEPGEPFGSISVQRAQIHLPPELPAAPEAIVIEDATIDEHGFSGEVSVAFATHRDDQDLEPLFGVIPIAFQSISLVIEQNLPTAFELRAAIRLPYFDEWVDVTIEIDDDFNFLFHVESVDPEGITLTKEELLLLNFRSATFEWDRSERRLSLGLSGGLEPLLWNADGLEWPRLDVTNLRVEQVLPASIDDPVEPPLLRFEEAWLDLKDLATLDLYGFHFELNRLGVGYVEATDELWVDLTGSLRLIEQIPVGLGVEGFRITWPRRIYEELGIGVSEAGVEVDLTVDEMLQLASRIQVRFDGIYLFYGIPQAVEFEGYIRFIKTAQKIGFAGDVALRVPTSGLAIEAGLMVGMNFDDPPYPFLYVYFGILLPTGIPLGQSGLALKGAKGLFGLNVEPDRDPEQNPYYDWYKRGPIEGVHPTNKWRDRIWSIALGAGITITTADGKILGVQGLLALAIPGPIIFVEGKALVFDGVFPIDSPLKALGYFDGTQLTTQLNIEASMELIEGVVDVVAGIEAFFDFQNLLNWHLYLGQDQPADRRVRANFLQLPAIGWLFGADAYLMIDMPHADDIGDSLDVDDLTVQARMGVHIGFEPPAIDLVVASARVHAVLDGGGLVTINPFLFTGGVDVDAVIDLDAFGLVIVGVQASAEMSIEGALPLDVRAELAVRVDLPVPDFDEVPLVGDELASAFDWFEETVVDLPDIPDHLEVEIPFHWRLDRPPVLDPLVSGVSVESRFAQGGVEAMPAGAAPVAAAPVVALDARPVISFDQNVNVVDGMKFGGFSPGGSELFHAGQLAFIPTLTGVRLFELPAHEFVDGASEQWTAVAATPDPDETGGIEELWGLFRPAGESAAPARAARRTLELWNANPFEHLTGSIPLAIPGQAAGTAGQVDPMEASGVTDVPWCDPTPARERCLGQDQLEQAHEDGRPRPVAGADQGTLGLRLDWDGLAFGLTMVAPDIRFGKQDDRFVVTLDAKRRERFATVRFPSRVTSVRIRFLGKEISAIARRRILSERTSTGVVVQDVDAHLLIDQAEVTTVVLTDPTGFDEVVLGGRSALHIVEVCWVPAHEAAAAAARASACAANATVAPLAVDAGTVLSPGAFYRIEVDTSVLMDEPAANHAAALLASLPGFSGGIHKYRAGVGGPYESTDVFYFRTEGPPADLRPYVKWMSPADQAIGHFTGDDLAIRFNRPYLHRFYPDDDNGAAGPPGSPYALEAYVEDAGGSIRSGWFLNWTTAASSTLVPEEQYWFDEIAPDSAPGVTPPPDDVLEIRRRLVVRSFSDVPPQHWSAVRIDASSTPRTSVRPVPPSGRRAQWKHVDANELAARLHGSVDTHLYVASEPTWGPVSVDVDVEIEPAAGGVGSAVGVVVSYIDEANHHIVRFRMADAGGDPRAPAAVAEIVRVDDGVAKVLESTQVRVAPGSIDRSIEFSVVVRAASAGMRIAAKVAGVEVVATSPLAPSEGAIGMLADGVDATFRRLSMVDGGEGLAPDTRYTLSLAGGAGGPTRRRDDFETPLDWWASTSGWSYGEDGLRASGPGSTLRFGEDFDDGEVTTTVVAHDGDAITIGLRTDDDRRGPVETRDRHRYELAVSHASGVCTVELRARHGNDGVSELLAAGQTNTGDTTRLPIRVRLIGDRVRAWVFDRQVVDQTLRPATFPNGTITDVVRRGSLEWRTTAGTPSLRSVHVCEAALLRTSFTTGTSASFAARVSNVETAPGAPVVASTAADAIVDLFDAAIAAQRSTADRRGALHSTQRRFALKRASREDVETERQDLTAARSALDSAVGDLLLDLDAGPLVVPTEPSIRRITTETGLVVGWVVRSPETLDPAMIASSGEAVFGSVGRTSFSMLDAAGATVPTHWVGSADGTTVVVHRISTGATLNPTAASTDLRPLLVDEVASAMRVVHVRDHRDDHSDREHLLDRAYELSRGARTDVVRTIALP